MGNALDIGRAKIGQWRGACGRSVIKTSCSLDLRRTPSLHASSFVSLRTNKDHANRKHLQDICRLNGIPGDVPGNLETRNSESFAEVLLSGLNGALLMVPESIAKQLCTSEDEEYVALPLKTREYDYDIRLFYSSCPTEQVTRLVKLLVSELT